MDMIELNPDYTRSHQTYRKSLFFSDGRVQGACGRYGVKTLPRQFVTAQIETSGQQSVPTGEMEGDNQIKVA